MAYYENLPIYKKAFDLTVFLENSVRGFSRYHKYSIGADLRLLSRNITSMVIKANSKKDKAELLTELRDRCEEMKLMIIVGKEIRAFKNFNQFQTAANFAVEICRQSEGWLGSQRKNRPESPKA